jgi:heptosyltransferase-2
MNRIALFLPGWIGDAVMATPAVRAARLRFPSATLIAVAKPAIATLFDGCPWFDEIIRCDKRSTWRQSAWGVARRLRQTPIDVAAMFSNSFRTALIARLGGCRRRIGFARYGRSPLLTDKLFYATDENGRYRPSPIIDDYNRVAVALGTDDPGHRLELFTTSADLRAAQRVWDEEGFDRAPEVIGLNCSGAFGAAKLWPTKQFAELARRFVDRRGSAVLVLCGPSERELAREIVRLADRPQVASLADRPVSLGLTKACVRRLDLLVTTDSGPRHFAAAFDRPVVTLFGPTFIAWTETYFAKAVHLQKKVPCGPCQQRVCPLDHRCMTELTPDDAWRAAMSLLANQPSPAQERRHAG